MKNIENNNLENKNNIINKRSLEDLLRENIALNKKIYASCQKSEKFIFFIKAFGIIKFILIVIPIVIGILYLIPLLSGFFDMYKEFFNHISEFMGTMDTLHDVKNIPAL